MTSTSKWEIRDRDAQFDPSIKYSSKVMVRLIEVFADLKIEEKIKEIWMNDPDKFNAERDMRRQRPNFELEGKTADFHPNELKKERRLYGDKALRKKASNSKTTRQPPTNGNEQPASQQTKQDLPTQTGQDLPTQTSSLREKAIVSSNPTRKRGKSRAMRS
ncbi:hypothetical protein M9H77_02307 [Catharanthus roseus]|uniref:Uncharacterized protein n=1 Tax=Catharanthus roseus TaxID=4058 RepID=A0ACC0C7Z9_CATRO|nr:hypothetical protein M9H77_02307 [Catharanthus roseus]